MAVSITSPADSAAGVAVNATVVFTVTTTALADVTVEIDSGAGFVTAYTSSAFVAPFTGSVVSTAGPTHDFEVTHPDWTPGGSISVRVSEGSGFAYVELNTGSPVDSVTIANHPDLNGSEFSFPAWFRMDASGSGGSYTLANKSGPSEGWSLSYASGFLSFIINPFFGAPNLSVSVALSSETWYHIAVTYDASGNAALYVDGVSIGTTTLAATITPTSQPFLLASANFGSTRIDMHRASYYDVELSPAQIAALHTAGLGSDPTGLGTSGDLIFVMDAASSTAPTVADLNAGGGAATTTHNGAFSHAGMDASNFAGGGGPATTWSFVTATVSGIRYATPPDESSGGLAFGGGGIGLAPASLSVHGSAEAPDAPAGVPVVTSWCAQGVGWLLSQYSGQPRMEAVLCAILDRAQEIEQALADVRDLFSLELATGATLSALGDAQGLPRSALPDPDLSDDAYRQALRAKAVADASPGSTQDVLRTLMRFLGGTDLPHYTADYPAGFYATLDNRHLFAEGRLMANLGRRAKPAAVRWHLRYQLRDTGLPTQTLSEVGGTDTEAMTEVGGTQIAVMAEADEGV